METASWPGLSDASATSYGEAGNTAWTVSAWGARKLDASSPLKEGEEECCICFAAAACVTLHPCRHKSCQGCLQSLRQTLIYKVYILA